MTKIVGTLGPRSQFVEVIYGCLKAGMSGRVVVGTTGRDFSPHVVKIKVGEACLSVSLAKPDGTVFGGTVAGSLIAARPVQLIIASFKQIIKKQLLKRHSVESSSANGMPGGDLAIVLRSHGKTKNVEENDVATPPSRFPELPSGTRNNIGDQNINLVFNQEASQPSTHMSDESMFDINDSVIEID
ncbi:AT-hook motif nuclear-localized protein 9 [Camellia lanceoleosa]|uniref:AT-hook motif nuclear-localized protein 9 n=1 Tax=Camellia lanceoleosa TaxID=1840588 RepID=A0ACC0GR58_9ERIC|nr:AT-hook motif nuclear-localized protein 9 [Camellia lanceoleosa]